MAGGQENLLAAALRAAAQQRTPAPAPSLIDVASMMHPSTATTTSLSTLLTGSSSAPITPRWIGVTRRFSRFHENLLLTGPQVADGTLKRSTVVSVLNRHYYGTNSGTDHSFLVGSWGKNTAIRPPRDVDLYFVLPFETYQRFEGYAWARQSALLQEVKDKLAATFWATEMRGDGQVVVVNFGTYCVEVAPTFALTTPGRYWICDTNGGGRYKETAPWAEAQTLETTDASNARNLRPLIRMLKAWQSCCSVELKSFQLELLASEFIAQSPWRQNDWFYFDWIARDFFAFLIARASGVVVVPGTVEIIGLGNAWLSKAQTAYRRAERACEHERVNNLLEAGDDWQRIFGADVPRMP